MFVEQTMSCELWVMSLVLIVEDFLKSLTQDIIIKIVMRTLASTKHIVMYIYVSINKYVLYIILCFRWYISDLRIYCSIKFLSCSLCTAHVHCIWSYLWESPLQFVFSNYPTHHLPLNIWQGVGNILAKPGVSSGETFSHSRERLFLDRSSPWGSL